ncbi:unnamed protein product [Paramecium pentaurelia]|uniref:Uncharacterized protein n=1 Tax=Paramecium pentaurelia TaxID=43138 RepID=A0A8S1YGX2_9CILI|nr:unnamed protein product [Paramecium pentaurelia]
MADQLPPGGLNRGLVISLCCSCPPGCPCKSNQLRKWHHKACGCPSFINEYGDIFCKNFRDKPECQGYFIQHAQFQCQTSKRSQTWVGFQTAAKFLMALAQGIQAAEFELRQGQNLVHFVDTLSQEVKKRWND